MNDGELADAVQRTNIFAKLSPAQKARVVRTLRGLGHAVAYMGDGVNDAAAMRESDCGTSVDSAVDVAREAADIILLEKDLMVLERGIECGRRTYANMIKYVKMTVSSNFGNIASVLVAAALLPFLPMTAVQLLLLNLIYDLTCTAIPWDNVDEDAIRTPRRWDTASVRRFMVAFGPLSSVFDILTFAALFFFVCPAVAGGAWGTLDAAGQALFVGTFQAGWFVESMWTQTLVVHLIRTEKVPFVGSRAALPLVMLGSMGIAVATAPAGERAGRDTRLLQPAANVLGCARRDGDRLHGSRLRHEETLPEPQRLTPVGTRQPAEQGWRAPGSPVPHPATCKRDSPFCRSPFADP